jgi:hypothetical protein
VDKSPKNLRRFTTLGLCAKIEPFHNKHFKVAQKNEKYPKIQLRVKNYRDYIKPN